MEHVRKERRKEGGFGQSLAKRARSPLEERRVLQLDICLEEASVAKRRIS